MDLTVMNRNISRVMRAARKRAGLTQSDIARIMGIGQSAVSDYENGTHSPGLVEWFAFCEATQIRPKQSLRTGFIDFDRPALLHPQEAIGSFRIRDRYKRDRGSKIRAMIPTLQYLSSVLGGETKRDEYLRHLGCDPDLFTCLDEQLSIRLFADIAKYLLMNGHLTDRTFPLLTAAVRSPFLHGRNQARFTKTTDPLELVGHMLTNGRLYDCNFRYEIVEKNESEIEAVVSPEEHVDEPWLKSCPTLTDFFCRYRKAYFHTIADFHGETGMPKITIDEPECYFKGASRCVYRIRRVA